MKLTYNDSDLILAPIAGFSNIALRSLSFQYGVGLAYTEMVRAKGLYYKSENTSDLLKIGQDEKYTGVQLFGSDPLNLAKAVAICEEFNPNIDFYDVNMGCPVDKVTKTGAGSSLLKNPKLCGDIIREMKKVTSKPVTAKIRLGWDHKTINFLEVIKELEEAGVDLISIHARTRKDLYLGSPYYELIKDVKKEMHVPLLVSGNIFTPEDALNTLEITHADGVMVARGGVGNPLLITNINLLLDRKEKEEYTFQKQKEYALKLAKEVIKEKGEERGMRIFRSMASKFFMNFPNAKYFRGRLTTELNTYDDLERIIKEYEKENIL